MLAIFAGILATWRLTFFLHDEGGPLDMAQRLRDAAGVTEDEWGMKHGDTFPARVLSCIYCLSVWVGAGVAILEGVKRRNVRDIIIQTFAYSAGAIMVHLFHEFYPPRIFAATTTKGVPQWGNTDGDFSLN